MRNSENTKWILHYLSLQVLMIYSTLMATGDRRTGPSCWGSPVRTSCPPPGVSVLNIPARGTKHSGCREWPASSMNTWVKWWLGTSAETNLKRKNKQTIFKRGKSTVIVVLIWNFNEWMIFPVSLVFHVVFKMILSWVRNDRSLATTFEG